MFQIVVNVEPIIDSIWALYSIFTALQSLLIFIFTVAKNKLKGASHKRDPEPRSLRRSERLTQRKGSLRHALFLLFETA